MDARAVRKQIREAERQRVNEIAAQIQQEEVRRAPKVKKNMGFGLLMQDCSDEEEESENDNYEEDITQPDGVEEIVEKDSEQSDDLIVEKEEEEAVVEPKAVAKQPEEVCPPDFVVGEEVWRKEQVCVITKIDRAVNPPAYTVKLKGTTRFVSTEASLLRKYVKKKRKKKRGRKKKKNPPKQQRTEPANEQKDDDGLLAPKKDDSPDSFDLLGCDVKFMNADQEMIRRFGKPIASDVDRRKRRERHSRPYQLHRKTYICCPKPEWPPLRVAGTGGGLYMSVLESNQDGISTFRLHFNDEYARQQAEYQARASTMDPHIVAQLLQVNHYHIDTLLTMSELLMRQNQIAEGTDFVERALFSSRMCLPREI